MRSRDHVPAVAIALALLLSSCGWFGGGDDTTTSTTVATATAPAEPIAQPQSLLQGDVEAPPGVEAQLGLTVAPMTYCPRILNGPNPVDDDAPFEFSSTFLARLMFGDLLYERVTERVEADPALADQIAALTPVFEIRDLAAIIEPPATRGTIPPQPGITFPTRSIPRQTVPATAPPVLVPLPEVTLPPTVTTPPIDVAPPAATPEVEQAGGICLSGAGWTPNIFLKVTIVHSDGTTVVDRFEPAKGDQVFVSWTPGLEDKVGRYTVTVTDNNNPATTEVDVVAPRQPAMDVLGPEVVEPGDVVTLGFVGFAPESTVAVSIFAENEFVGWRYTGTADNIAISGVGSAVYQLQTLVDDPTGVYCVLLNGAPQWTCPDVQFAVGD